MTAPNPHSTTTPGTEYQVLICTYNGANYIVEQLYSILGQQPAPVGILVSDDGSTDSTVDIVRQIAQTSDIPIQVIEGPGRGVIANVLSALSQTTAPYVFLADQDDIWLDNKAALFCEQMDRNNRPHLIFSDAWVWRPGKDEKHSFWELDQLRPGNAKDPRRLAFHNTVQGASACVNRSLIAAMAPTAQHPDIVMHDWWLALIASGIGHIDYITEPTLLYRQHDNNQVGSQNKANRRKRKLADTLAIANRILRQAVAFTDHYYEALPVEHRGFFKTYQEAMKSSVFHRIGFILRYWPQHRDMNRTVKLWASILLVQGARQK